MNSTTPKPLFSVVIPTFNRLELLREALESVWAQTFTDYEVIVVDDGSDDGTWQYLQTLNHVTSLVQKNAGPGAARNLGAQNANGKYLAFLDSDDLWFPWTLKVFAEAVEIYPEFTSLCGRLSQSGKETRDENSTNSFDATRLRFFNCYLAAAAEGRYAGAGMIAVEKEAFLRIGGFDIEIRNSEDHDLMLRLGSEPGFVQVESPQTLVRRLQSDSLAMNLPLNSEGVSLLIAREKRGGYPGNARDRRCIIAQHARASSFHLLNNGAIHESFGLYWSTLLWQLKLGRLKYLLVFPVVLALRQIGLNR